MMPAKPSIALQHTQINNSTWNPTPSQSSLLLCKWDFWTVWIYFLISTSYTRRISFTFVFSLHLPQSLFLFFQEFLSMCTHSLQQGEQGSPRCLALDDHSMSVPDTSLVFIPTLWTWGLWDSSFHRVHWFETRSHCALPLSDIFKMFKWTGTDRLIEDERAAWALDSSLALLMLSELAVLGWHQRQYPLRSHNSKQSIYLCFLLQV